MKIRKIVYNIDYTHILTFRENYKTIIAPYFSYKFEYAIDAENTNLESIRLVFRTEAFVLIFRKDGITMIYEGDVALVKKSNPIVQIFFEVYEKIKRIPEYQKTNRHKIVIDAVEFADKAIVDKELEFNTYLKSPFGKLDEFAIVYQFTKGTKNFNIQFGNYNEGDIVKYDLMPFNSVYNQDLKGNLGFINQTTIQEDISNTSFSKFKELIDEVEGVIRLHKEKTK